MPELFHWRQLPIPNDWSWFSASETRDKTDFPQPDIHLTMKSLWLCPLLTGLESRDRGYLTLLSKSTFPSALQWIHKYAHRKLAIFSRFVEELLHLWVSVCLQVVFEVGFNSPRGGHVALDDISFSPEFCNKDTGELWTSVFIMNPNKPTKHLEKSFLPERQHADPWHYFHRADLRSVRRQLWFWIWSLPLHPGPERRVVLEKSVGETQHIQEWRPHHRSRWEKTANTTWWDIAPHLSDLAQHGWWNIFIKLN